VQLNFRDTLQRLRSLLAVAFVPFVIRWGADASSDVMRTHARCTTATIAYFWLGARAS